jgi:hypothetical protein
MWNRVHAGLAVVAGLTAGMATLVPIGQPAWAQVNRNLYITNRCATPVRFFVFHRHNDGQMYTHGWYNQAGNSGPSLITGSSGAPLVHLDGEPLHFYAEATNGSGTWEGPTRAQFNGVSYGLMRANLFVEGGRLGFSLSCTNAQARTPAPRPAPAPAGITPGVSPAYGSISLRGGFTPDPRTVSLRAGGNIEASRIMSSCRGYVAAAPDVRLNFSPGSLPLILSVVSSTDTTLLVRSPSGRLFCDDDGGQGLNPSLRFERPESGAYDIWVGNYGGRNANPPATLHISELSSQ